MGVLVLIVTFYFIGGFQFEEMTTAVALITPMFASFTTVIVKQVIAERSKRVVASPAVNGAFVFLSFFFPALFVAYLGVITFLKAFNVKIENVEQFKGLLAVGETGFAVYIGMFIGSLFQQPTV